jgi:hypothetical protein
MGGGCRCCPRLRRSINGNKENLGWPSSTLSAILTTQTLITQVLSLNSAKNQIVYTHSVRILGWVRWRQLSNEGRSNSCLRWWRAGGACPALLSLARSGLSMGLLCADLASWLLLSHQLLHCLFKSGDTCIHLGILLFEGSVFSLQRVDLSILLSKV